MFKYCKVQVGLDWLMQKVNSRERGGVSRSVRHTHTVRDTQEAYGKGEK